MKTEIISDQWLLDGTLGADVRDVKTGISRGSKHEDQSVNGDFEFSENEEFQLTGDEEDKDFELSGDDEDEDFEVATSDDAKVEEGREKVGRTLSALARKSLRDCQELSDTLSNQCTFQCPKCKEDLPHINATYSHWRECRQATKMSIYAALKKTVCHVCRICQLRVLCDLHALRRHAKSHGVLLAKYCKDFSLHMKKAKPNFRRTPMTELIREKYNSSTTKLITEEIGNLCKFACCECGAKFDNFNGFRTHQIKKSHRDIQPDKTFVKLAMHQCCICKENIISDTTFLNHHIKRKHRLSVSTYVSQFKLKRIGPQVEREKMLLKTTSNEKLHMSDNVGNLCLFKCKDCGCMCRNLAKLNSHFDKTSHGEKAFAMLNASKYIAKSVWHQCKICKEVILSDVIILSRHFKKHKFNLTQYCEQYGLTLTSHKTEQILKATNGQCKKEGSYAKQSFQTCQDLSDTITNQCIFQCPKCKQNYSALHAMKKHWQSCQRGSKLSTYSALAKTVCHVCRICKLKVLCDLAALSVHMNKHGLKLTQYCKDFELIFLRHGAVMDLIKAKFASNSTMTDAVGSLCQFACEDCGDKFNALAALRQHEKLKFHKQRGADRAITRVVLHCCRICQEDIVSDLCFLIRHFKYWHRLSISEYIAQHNLVKAGPLIKKREKAETIMTADMEMSDHVGNICLLKCYRCDRTFNSLTTLHYHFKKTLHEEIRSDILSTLNYFTKRVGHKCRECKEIILCDVMFLSKHLRSKHKVNIKEYCAKYGLILTSRRTLIKEEKASSSKNSSFSLKMENRCLFKCSKCDKVFSSWYRMTQHLGKIHKMIKEDYLNKMEDFVSTPVFHECLLCKKTEYCDKGIFSLHLRRAHNLRLSQYALKCPESKTQATHSDLIGDLCRYTCGNCKQVFSDAPSLTRHLRESKHETNFNYHTDRHMTKYVLHRCRICSRSVKNELTCFRIHTTRVHGGLLVKDYVKRFKLEYARDVNRKDYSTSLERFLESVPTFNPLQPYSQVTRNQVPTNRLTHVLGNLCKFTCTPCDGEIFLNWKSYYAHVRRFHAKEEDNYSPLCVKEARYHKCFLCSQPVLCDLHFICYHALAKHSMNQGSYEKLVRQCGGKLFPTYSKWNGGVLMPLRAVVKMKRYDVTDDSPKSFNPLALKRCFVKLKRLEIL